MTVRRVSTASSWTRRGAFAVAGGLLLLIAGCGGPRPCVVMGTLLVDDRPVEGVYVVLDAIGQPASANSGTARTDKEGLFSLAVGGPGEFVVTVFWPKVRVEDGEIFEGADLFANRYRDPSHPVAKLTVREGDNTLSPIKLAGPPAQTKTRFRR